MVKKKDELDEAEVVETLESPKVESEAKKAFRAVIEAYKVKNPTKFELKKVALEEQLANLE